MQAGILGGFKHCTDFATVVIIIIIREGLSRGDVQAGMSKRREDKPH